MCHLLVSAEGGVKVSGVLLEAAATLQGNSCKCYILHIVPYFRLHALSCSDFPNFPLFCAVSLETPQGLTIS